MIPYCDHGCTKNWDGSDATCAVPDGVFNDINWNCGVVNRIRDLCDHADMHPLIDYQYCDDQKYATLNIGGVALGDDVWALALWVTWYKSRGATMGMWILDHHDLPRKPTAAELITIADWFEAHP